MFLFLSFSVFFFSSFFATLSPFFLYPSRAHVAKSEMPLFQRTIPLYGSRNIWVAWLARLVFPLLFLSLSLSLFLSFFSFWLLWSIEKTVCTCTSTTNCPGQIFLESFDTHADRAMISACAKEILTSSVIQLIIDWKCWSCVLIFNLRSTWLMNE